MKLLTHNMLTSHVKGVTKGYPLLIKATEVKVNEVEFNPQFVSRMIPKVEWTLAPLLGNNSSSELSAPLWFHVIVVVRED
uniref:tRNA methyltransferase activator subunit 11-2 n=1 Tax=Lates calcarifer TaxID=8187 RepID=A0A4W6EUN8_LATCA